MSQARERAMALLSAAGLSVDMMVVMLLTLVLRNLINSDSLGLGIGQAPVWLVLALIPLIALLYFVLVETIFGGYSIGRLATGLSLVNQQKPAPARAGQRLKRLASAASTAGLRSAKLTVLPSYSKQEDCCLNSDWIGDLPESVLRSSLDGRAAASGSASASKPKPRGRPTARRGGGLITVSGGPCRGLALDVDSVLGAGVDGMIIVGRDPARAHLVLDRDPKVSRVHCRIARRGAQYTIADGLDARSPSSHGTLVSGKRINSDQAVLLSSKAVISVGESTLVLMT